MVINLNTEIYQEKERGIAMDQKDQVDVIKYEGANDVLVWKHPREDFNTGTQLIVHESQEALLFLNGQALDLFGAGRHTLETQNLPVFSKFMKRPLGDQTPFHCEVYFINKVSVLDILWGTASPIPVQDPKYNIILPVRANGQFGLRVDNGRKLLLKLVGTTKSFDKETLMNYFRGLLMTHIKDYISQLMVEKQISFLEIHGHIAETSEILKNKITPLFDDFGFDVVNFFVNSITVPSDDPGYTRIRNALAAAKEKELLAKGKRAEMDIVGYTYQQQRSFDVLDKAASNEGTAGNIMGAGMGLGMGFGVGGTVGGVMSGAMQNIKPEAISEKSMNCAKCGAVLPADAKFCLSCGEKVTSADTVICSKCGQPTMKGNFCLSCGAPLIIKCPDCGKQIPEGSKFCLECGHKF